MAMVSAVNKRTPDWTRSRQIFFTVPSSKQMVSNRGPGFLNLSPARHTVSAAGSPSRLSVNRICVLLARHQAPLAPWLGSHYRTLLAFGTTFKIDYKKLGFVSSTSLQKTLFLDADEMNTTASDSCHELHESNGLVLFLLFSLPGTASTL